MLRGKSTQDPSILEMALVGYEMEKQKIDEKIRDIRSQLGARRTSSSQGNSVGTASDSATPKKRTLSAAARRRIAAAQKKRWAEHRRKQAQGG
jgi:hypothetical protein